MSRLALAALGAVALSALWVQTGRLERARTEADMWEASSKSQSEALDRLETARQAMEAALLERQAMLDDLSRKRAVERTAFKEARHGDQQVDDWGRAVLPDVVARLLKEGGPVRGDAGQPRSAGADRADSVAGSAFRPGPQ